MRFPAGLQCTLFLLSASSHGALGKSPRPLRSLTTDIRHCSTELGTIGMCKLLALHNASHDINVNPGASPLYVALLMDKSGSNSIYDALTVRAVAQRWPAMSFCCDGIVTQDRLCDVNQAGAACLSQPAGAVVLDTKFGFCERVVKASRSCQYIVIMRDPLDRLISAYNFFCVACHEDGRECTGFGCPQLSLVEYARKTGPYYTQHLPPYYPGELSSNSKAAVMAADAIKKFLEPAKIAFASTLEHIESRATILETVLAGKEGARRISMADMFAKRMNAFVDAWDHPERRDDLAPMATARTRVRSKQSLNQSQMHIVRQILAPDYELYHHVARLEQHVDGIGHEPVKDAPWTFTTALRSEEHTSELQSR